MMTRAELAEAARKTVKAAMSAPDASFAKIAAEAGVRSDVVKKLYNDDYLPLRGAGRVTTASLAKLAAGVRPECGDESLTERATHGVNEMEWRPIETAPKDETEVLIWCGWIDVASYSWTDERGDWWQHSGTPAVQPTHWMPLPEPPK